MHCDEGTSDAVERPSNDPDVSCESDDTIIQNELRDMIKDLDLP